MVLVGYARDGIDGFLLQAQVDELKAGGCEPIWQEHDPQPYLSLGIGSALEQAIEHARGGGAVMVSSLEIIADSLVYLTRTLTEMRDMGTHLVSIGPPAIDTRGPAGWRILELLHALVLLEQGGQQRKLQWESVKNVVPRRKAKGRKPKVNDSQVLELSQLGYKPYDIAVELKVSRATVYRHLKAAKSGDTADLLQDGE